jgi:hypothetical protein
MKVNMGTYPSRLRCEIHTNHMHKKYGYNGWNENESRMDSVMEFIEDRIQSMYNVVNWLWLDRRSQKINVRIDEFDTWSMDHTLAYIIEPMLKQLKLTTHGAPLVDLSDVPKELRPTKKELKLLKNGETDSKLFDRWDWVMGEMIFAFESKHIDWEEQFHSGEHDTQWIKLTEGKLKGHSEMVKGPNDTFEIDWEGRKAYQDRITNGFRLFGKYYEGLWD